MTRLKSGPKYGYRSRLVLSSGWQWRLASPLVARCLGEGSQEVEHIVKSADLAPKIECSCVGTMKSHSDGISIIGNAGLVDVCQFIALFEHGVGSPFAPCGPRPFVWRPGAKRAARVRLNRHRVASILNLLGVDLPDAETHGSRLRGQLGDGFNSGSQAVPGRILNDFAALRRSRPVLGVFEFGPVEPRDLYLPCAPDCQLFALRALANGRCLVIVAQEADRHNVQRRVVTRSPAPACSRRLALVFLK